MILKILIIFYSTKNADFLTAFEIIEEQKVLMKFLDIKDKSAFLMNT